jgi:hypothetical protein
LSARRRLLGSVGLVLAAAALAAPTPARAQYPRAASPGEHVLPPVALTPEQVKQALERLGAPGGQDLLRNLPPGLLDQLKKEFEKGGPEHGLPKLDPRQAEALRRLLDNPAVRKQLEGMERNGQLPARREDVEKLLKGMPGLPKDLPRTLGPGPQGTDPPRFNPKDLLPADPKVGPRPPEPVPKRDDAPAVPDPARGGAPAIPPVPELGGGLHPDPEFPDLPSPFDPNESSRERAMRTAASLWERNIGPLDDTPAVKRALFDLVEGSEDFKDADGNSFWDTLAKESGDATSLADFIDQAALGESWTLPKLGDLPSFNLNWSRSNPDIGRGGDGPAGAPGESWWSRRRAPSVSGGGSAGSGWNFGIPGLEGSWLPVVLLAAVLLGALVYWRFWYLRDPQAESVLGLGGLGPWPVDPRRLATRKDVVLAFEYLSVLICGPAAKTWTHTTIAGALADLATTHGETARMLARLYELARYAPADEPLSTAELAEARRLVCRLAGLGDE